MVVTRNKVKAVFDHILDVVWDCYGSANLKSALIRDGFVDILLLLSMGDAYTDPNDATKEVPDNKPQRIRIIMIRPTPPVLELAEVIRTKSITFHHE